MTYKVTAYCIEADIHTPIGTYETEFEAHSAIVEAIEEDILYGDYERYDYYVNGKKVA